MTLRITNQVLSDSVSRSISSAQQRLSQLQRAMADGRAIHLPSDDPTGTSLSLWYRSQGRAAAQYSRSLDQTISQLSARDSTLGQIQDVMTEIRTLQTTGADDATGADGRSALATQVGQLLESVVELGNARFGGSYVFGGSRSDEPPLVAMRDAKGNITAVKFNPNGVTGAWTRSGGSDVSLVLHANAADVFGQGGEVFSEVLKLQSALAGNDGTAVRARGTPLEEVQKRVDLVETTVGSLSQRAQNLKAAAESAGSQYEAGRSGAEDLDMAKALVEAQTVQNALSAALSSGSKILNLSLLDYLS